MKYTTTVLLAVLVLSCTADDELPEKFVFRRSYVCPPNFIRLGHKCYYFSQEKATWQDAYYKCRGFHSNLAIIKNANQDKVIKRTLSKKSLAPLERWIGGLYDWEQMAWKWAASGNPLVYNSFAHMDMEDKEKLRWQCIIVDPNLQYKWSTRSCLQEKNFICHTKMKTVTNKGKKKLAQQYNVNKYNKLNEIPVPTIADDLLVNSSISRWKDGRLDGVTFEISNDLSNAQFASKPSQIKRRGRKNRRKKLPDTLQDSAAGTGSQSPASSRQQGRRRKNKRKEGTENMSMDRLKWKTYYKNATINPLHPKAIVEEYNYVKEE